MEVDSTYNEKGFLSVCEVGTPTDNVEEEA
jgi:hypothetical protein